jgi:hypothetical protein
MQRSRSMPPSGQPNQRHRTHLQTDQPTRRCDICAHLPCLRSARLRRCGCGDALAALAALTDLQNMSLQPGRKLSPALHQQGRCQLETGWQRSHRWHQLRRLNLHAGRIPAVAAAQALKLHSDARDSSFTRRCHRRRRALARGLTITRHLEGCRTWHRRRRRGCAGCRRDTDEARRLERRRDRAGLYLASLPTLMDYQCSFTLVGGDVQIMTLAAPDRLELRELASITRARALALSPPCWRLRPQRY